MHACTAHETCHPIKQRPSVHRREHRAGTRSVEAHIKYSGSAYSESEIRTAGVAFGLRFHQEEEMYNKKGPLSARWDEDDVEVQYMIVQTKLSKLRFNCKRSALPKCTHSPHVPHQQQEHRFIMDLRAAEREYARGCTPATTRASIQNGSESRRDVCQLSPCFRAGPPRQGS